MKKPDETVSFQSFLENCSQDQHLDKIVKIAVFISNLPSERILRENCKTEDLQFFWWQLRCSYKQVARCFMVESLEKNTETYSLELKDSLKEALNQKWINRRDIELYKLESKRLMMEWDLIEYGFPYLAEEIVNFQFFEDIKLFFNILEYQNDKPIKQRASSYYEILSPKRADFFEKVYTAAQGDLRLGKEVLSSPLVHRHALKEEIIILLSQKDPKDELIKQKLQALQIAHNDVAWVASESCNARNSNGKLLKSEVWKNGERYLLTKWGLERASYVEDLKSHISESQLKEIKLILQYLRHTS